MASVTKFEELYAWQEARKLVKSIYKITSEGAFAKDYGMRDQIQRASVSAMTNIAEGFDCESTAEFARFLGIARRSAVEVQSLLYVALDVEYIKDGNCSGLGGENRKNDVRGGVRPHAHHFFGIFFCEGCSA